MPTWRKLHVKTVESQSVQELPDDFHRLLWVLLPLGLDREGRGIYNPAWIKSKVMPLRVDVTSDDIARAFEAFHIAGLIKPYKVNGRLYFWVPTFATYQGNTTKEAPSHFPDPPRHEDPSTIIDYGEFTVPDSAQPGDVLDVSDLVPTNSGQTPDQLRTNATTDADADADSDSKEKGNEPAAADPKRDLLLKGSTSGKILELQMSIARESKGRTPFRYYANRQQRDAYLIVYDQLGNELKPLIVKGLTRQRESLTAMLAWLQECAKRTQPAKRNRRTQSAEQTLKLLEETDK